MHEGPYQAKAKSIYAELRENVIDNVFKVRRRVFIVLVVQSSDFMKEYERTGYVWEQYDAITGEGRRRCGLPGPIPRRVTHKVARSSHPFTGWTSLVTLSEYCSTYELHLPTSHRPVNFSPIREILNFFTKFTDWNA